VKPLNMTNPRKHRMTAVAGLVVWLMASKRGTENSVQLKPKKIRTGRCRVVSQ
jgi:hypothetical protein